MEAKTLSRSGFEGLVADLVAKKVRVLAPTRMRADSDTDSSVDYGPVQQASDISLQGSLPVRSIKGAFLPQTEVLFSWKRGKDGLKLSPVSTPPPKTVIIGARPCDAAAPEIVDKLMGWDYRDESWFARREATTIVALACEGLDSSCFCTAVGSGPDATRGADLLLTPVGKDFHVDVLTKKGESLVKEYSSRFEAGGKQAEATEFRTKARAKMGRAPVPAALGPWLEGHFEDPYWPEIARTCIGCGACAFVCPTCHCFDIVDEARSVSTGTRNRNWDTCQTPVFTLHGSGHNPRAHQGARYRQRVTHKFSIYPKRFGQTLCTGCGRCIRACPAGIDLLEILETLSARAGGAE
ncbi:MAG: 4Fe-4S dicluster domain-containing protein [Polyangiaceae bacterium]|nr:4Fe-4S dicluster domain-containing protein [Polyangiaceae bacterium]